jgi:hypothetical protein
MFAFLMLLLTIGLPGHKIAVGPTQPPRAIGIQFHG